MSRSSTSRSAAASSNAAAHDLNAVDDDKIGEFLSKTYTVGSAYLLLRRDGCGRSSASADICFFFSRRCTLVCPSPVFVVVRVGACLVVLDLFFVCLFVSTVVQHHNFPPVGIDLVPSGWFTFPPGNVSLSVSRHTATDDASLPSSSLASTLVRILAPHHWTTPHLYERLNPPRVSVCALRFLHRWSRTPPTPTS